jgi:hypothetical protein
MKMIQHITMFTLATVLALPVMAQSTANMEILRDKIKADKKLVIAENMKLTDAEGAKFWPVYDAYQKDLTAINQRLAATIKAYAEAYNKGPVTDETAKKLLDEYMAIEDSEAKLKIATTPKVLAVLPAAKAARYIQIENKIRAEIRYELAAGIPLVQ